MTVRIDKRLYLVVPVYQDDEGKELLCYVHSAPLAREVVERHFMPLVQTFSAIYSQGIGRAGGQSVAMLMLKQIASNTGTWDGPAGVGALIEEIKRTTTVLVPGATTGAPWVQVPIDAAVQRGFLSDDDRAEVENAIVFFIVNYAMLPRHDRKEMVTAAAALWGAQISSSTATEFSASLKTLIGTGSSGEKSPAPVSATVVTANAVVDGKPASLPH